MNGDTGDHGIRTARIGTAGPDSSPRAPPCESRAPGLPVEVTDECFPAFARENRLAVVDFWAPWCPPCRMIAPVLEALAKEYAGKVAVGKINVDEHSRVARALGIEGIPTLLFLKGGAVVGRVVGALPRRALKEAFDGLLASPERSG